MKFPWFITHCSEGGRSLLTVLHETQTFTYGGGDIVHGGAGCQVGSERQHVLHAHAGEIPRVNPGVVVQVSLVVYEASGALTG